MIPKWKFEFCAECASKFENFSNPSILQFSSPHVKDDEGWRPITAKLANLSPAPPPPPVPCITINLRQISQKQFLYGGRQGLAHCFLPAPAYSPIGKSAKKWESDRLGCLTNSPPPSSWWQIFALSCVNPLECIPGREKSKTASKLINCDGVPPCDTQS